MKIKPTNQITLTCEVCEKEFLGDPPGMCCSGRECGCMGRPIDPVVCSMECFDKIINKYKKMKTGIELIAEERQRQIKEEGYSAEHDQEHRKGELAIVAMCYTCPAKYRPMFSPVSWLQQIGWNLKWWKPSTHIRDLQKAGALIAAEIDRLQNLK